MFRNRAPSVALVVALALSLAACGESATDTTSTSSVPATTGTTATPADTGTTETPGTTAVDSGFPSTVEWNGVETVIAARPVAIVSLSPTATEMLFAIGAGDQVVAVDEFSYFPPEAPVTDLSGFTPNLEAIVGYDPDLVVVTDDVDGIAGALEAVNIPTIILPAATVVEDAYAQIRVLGTATGLQDRADAFASEMQSEIAALVAGIGTLPEPLTYYHELGSDGGGSFYSVTSSTFIGEVFDAFGLENIADPADTDGFGYPVLSVEYIIDADPDLIFYTSCCGDTAESISARPGWDTISAVDAGAMYELDDDLASRWGPRLVGFFEVVASALAERTEG